MKRILFMLVLFLLLPMQVYATSDQKLYDYAELLNAEEVANIEALADQYSRENEVDIIILTTNDTGGRDIVDYMDDFYDETAPGFQRAHGDTVILTLDMAERDVYIAGFKRAEDVINDQRASSIRQEITPALSAGDYVKAFTQFIEQTDYYWNVKPIYFTWWFHLIVSIAVAAIVVGVMAYNSGGRKTTNPRTYLDENRSAVTRKRDLFIRKTVTKTKKPSNNSSGGGGGITRGGHSHSGSRGKF